jgi:SnoaL-like protein
MPAGPDRFDLTKPRQFAERYVEIINRGTYGELGDLFAPDAEFLAPHHQVLRGRQQIADFYEKFLAEISPHIRIASYVEQGDECVFELEAALHGSDEFRLGAIDHATVRADGDVVRLAVFTK